MAYKSAEVVGVRLHNIESDFLIYVTPFGAYLDIDKGARCCTSSWRRVEDTGIPARAKISCIYANSALAKTEANLNGFDEAIMLDERGPTTPPSGERVNPRGLDYNQAQAKVIEQSEPVGHAVRAMYMYSGMADVAALTGDLLRSIKAKQQEHALEVADEIRDALNALEVHV